MAARRRLLAALAALATLGGAGCGSDSGNGSAPPATTATETAERAELPRGWQRHTNFDAGVTLGLPPLWSVRDRGIRTIARSPDRLVAITITADRTTDALAIEVADFARRVAASLAGYRRIDPGGVERFAHRYEAAAVEARGVTEGGVRQDVLVVVLSRDGLAKVTALAAWNRTRTRARDVRDTRRILRTIRTRPVG